MKKDMDACSILLTRREIDIMNVIWEKGTATVKEVWDVINQKKVTAYTTILTIMSILERKCILDHIRSGRAYIYRPILSRQQVKQNHVRDIIARYFDGNPEKLIADVRENVIKAPEPFINTKEQMESWQTNDRA
jgi:predicted transcriptional regulator